MIEIFFLICILQTLFIVLYLRPKKGGLLGGFFTLFFAPLLQLGFGWLVLSVLFNIVNSGALYFGLGAAYMLITAGLTLVFGFLLTPILLRFARGHKKYFVTPCPHCTSDIYWGQYECKKCHHQFSNDEISELRVKLEGNE